MKSFDWLGISDTRRDECLLVFENCALPLNHWKEVVDRSKEGHLQLATRDCQRAWTRPEQFYPYLVKTFAWRRGGGHKASSPTKKLFVIDSFWEREY